MPTQADIDRWREIQSQYDENADFEGPSGIDLEKGYQFLAAIRRMLAYPVAAIFGRNAPEEVRFDHVSLQKQLAEVELRLKKGVANARGVRGGYVYGVLQMDYHGRPEL